MSTVGAKQVTNGIKSAKTAKAANEQAVKKDIKGDVPGSNASAYYTVDEFRWNNWHNASTHKALDISGLGMNEPSEKQEYTYSVKTKDKNGNETTEQRTGQYKYFDTQDDARFKRYHQMTIYTTKGFMITSNLPERIQYSLNSQWQSPLNFGSASFNLLAQFANQIAKQKNLKYIKDMKSGISRAGTVRIWGGTDPLVLNLTIPVVDDYSGKSGTNLVEALEKLGQLVLPSYEERGWYTPPPSPLSVTFEGLNKSRVSKEEKGKTDLTLSNSNWARTIVQLGGVLTLDHCIIENLTVNYPDTKTMIKHNYTQQGKAFAKLKTHDDGSTSHDYEYLHPLLAEVTLRISTVEAPTAGKYSSALWGRSQSYGVFSSDIGNTMVDEDTSSETTNTNKDIPV